MAFSYSHYFSLSCYFLISIDPSPFPIYPPPFLFTPPHFRLFPPPFLFTHPLPTLGISPSAFLYRLDLLSTLS